MTSTRRSSGFVRGLLGPNNDRTLDELEAENRDLRQKLALALSIANSAARVIDQLGGVDAVKRALRSRPTIEKMDAVVCRYLSQHAHRALEITISEVVEHLKKTIRCGSRGSVTKCPSWRVFEGERKALRGGGSVRAQRLGEWEASVESLDAPVDELVADAELGDRRSEGSMEARSRTTNP